MHLDERGRATDGGAAPYLDCRPATSEELTLLAPSLSAPWLEEDLERRALGFAIETIVPRHLEEVKSHRLATVAKVEREVRARLVREIGYWESRAHRLREEERAGKDQRLNAVRAVNMAEALADRLEKRPARVGTRAPDQRPAAGGARRRADRAVGVAAARCRPLSPSPT